MQNRLGKSPLQASEGKELLQNLLHRVLGIAFSPFQRYAIRVYIISKRRAPAPASPNAERRLKERAMREEISPLISATRADNAALYTHILDISEALQALRDNDWQVRTAAAMALEEIGPRAAVAVPDLIRTLEKDGREEVRRAAAEALGSIKPTTLEAISALTRALEGQSSYVRWAAAKALSAINGRRSRERQ
jgi:HEAT repeat protein